MVAVHISRHSLFVSRSRSVVDCARVQAFTFLLTKTLSRSRSVVWCVVWFVCGVVLWCGSVVWCVVKLGTLSLSLSLVLSPSSSLSLSFSLFLCFFFFSCSFSYSCSCSCSFSFSSFFFLLPSTHSSLLFSFTPTNTVQSTDQQTRRPTLRRLNVMWRTECSHLSFLFYPPSSLPPTPRTKRGDFLLQEYVRRGIYFYYSFKLIPKNRRRVKLQSLQFYINSKTINLHHVNSVIVFAKMVFSA